MRKTFTLPNGRRLDLQVGADCRPTPVRLNKTQRGRLAWNIHEWSYPFTPEDDTSLLDESMHLWLDQPRWAALSEWAGRCHVSEQDVIRGLISTYLCTVAPKD